MTAKHHKPVKRKSVPSPDGRAAKTAKTAKTAGHGDLPPAARSQTTKIDRAPDANRYRYYILAGVLLLSLMIYWPSTQNHFVAGDDYVILVENPDIRSLSNVPKFFTQAYHAMYCPVKMISHAVDYLFSGMNPAGYHFFSILYHLINVALVFIFIFLLLPNAWGAGVAALLFALHPMNVEAAVWITGRGDLLYAGFYLSGLIAYLRYLTNGLQTKHLLYTGLFFALSALSKASAFTFPLALLALDWYYRRKIASWRVWIEKAPFLAGAFILGVSAILLRSEHSAPLSDYLAHFSGVDNIAIFLYPLTFYLIKFIVPVGLALPYPHPFASSLPLSWHFYVYPVILPAIGLLIWRCKTLRRPLAFAFMFYIATLLSAMRLTPMLGTIAADRYFYITMVAVVFFVAWGFDYLYRKRALWRRRAFPTACIVVAAFAVMTAAMTRTRIRVFKDGISLFSDAHRKYPQHATPLYELCGGYVTAGDMDNALRTVDKINQLLPDNENALAFQTNLFLMTQRLADALSNINRLIRINPDDNYYLTNASIYTALHQPDSVLATVDALLQRAPTSSETLITAGKYQAGAYVDLLRSADAIALADSLRKRFPESYAILMERANASFNIGRTNDAIRDLLILIEHEPENALAMLNLGKIYHEAGRRDEACRYWRRAAAYQNQEAIELFKQCQ
ncbi:MAG: tetratricopeptide repeat protein [Prevotellaceae bacterium]|jgi:tetratricopeptide (TPR) repeat protein|nr:tetratricopeptide repeat protein [Prevotellaceae bacterium]